MQKELRDKILKMAEEVGKQHSDEYLEARKGKVPVNPPKSPEDEGDAPTYPVDALKKESAIQLLRSKLGLSKEAKEMCPECKKPGCECPSGNMCPDCRKEDCKCGAMEKESALKRVALNLLKYAQPMPPGAEGGMAPPPGEQAPPPPPMAPEAPPAPPEAAAPEAMPAAPAVPPELMAKLQQHLQEHQMMEQMGMYTEEEAMEEEHGGEGAPEMEYEGPEGEAGADEGDAGPGPEIPEPEEEKAQIQKESAVRILKEVLGGY